MSFLSKHSTDGKAPFSDLFSKIPALTDLDGARIKLMDDKGVDTHVLVPLPWIDPVRKVAENEELALEACRICNEEMALAVSKHPSRFVGVGLLPLSCGGEVMMKSYHHAIHILGLSGVVLFLGPHSTPPDDVMYEKLYEECENNDTPIWIHPNRPPTFKDYTSTSASQYAIWNSLGWVYDTSVAMVHMAMSGVFQRYPNLKVVGHHGGGMVPFFTERFETQLSNFEGDGEKLLEDLKMFYCDTATFGYQPKNIKACLDFFEEGRVLFGTDTPMDMASPGYFTDTALRSVEALEVGREEKENVLAENALKFLGKAGDRLREIYKRGGLEGAGGEGDLGVGLRMSKL
ncbi:hypothetical protein TrST_g11180 [Triparma strigata]|uniref:Amidohydrolase-related domain-containing protein n=1 Tax=Triparma strigata TaxID=1606541 RepID=A0A9W7ER54_9STRA|nr:hypothetical protein TrST_g11180 [Triparma strigata]